MPESGRPASKRGDIDAVVAIRAVIGTKDRIHALSLIEAGLYVGSGDGHAVARLMAGRTRTPIGAQALKERASQIDSAAGCAVGFRSTIGIPEEYPVGDEIELLPVYANNGKEDRDLHKNTDENAALVLAKKSWSFG